MSFRERSEKSLKEIKKLMDTPETPEERKYRLQREEYNEKIREEQEKIDKNTNIWKKRLSIFIPLLLIGILVIIVIYFMTKSDDTPENVTSAYRVDNTYK